MLSKIAGSVALIGGWNHPLPILHETEGTLKTPSGAVVREIGHWLKTEL